MVTVHTIRQLLEIASQDGDFFQSKSTQPPVVTHTTCPMALNAMCMATGTKQGMCEKSHIPLPFCHSEK